MATSCNILRIGIRVGMDLGVILGEMTELLLDSVEYDQHQQPEERTDQGHGDLAQSGGGTGRSGHPDACRGRQSVDLVLAGELENGAAAQKPDSGREALHDPRQRIQVHAGFGRAHNKQGGAQANEHVGTQAGGVDLVAHAAF